jgi:hypothetical protein
VPLSLSLALSRSLSLFLPSPSSPPPSASIILPISVLPLLQPAPFLSFLFHSLSLAVSAAPTLHRPRRVLLTPTAVLALQDTGDDKASFLKEASLNASTAVVDPNANQQNTSADVARLRELDGGQCRCEVCVCVCVCATRAVSTIQPGVSTAECPKCMCVHLCVGCVYGPVMGHCWRDFVRGVVLRVRRISSSRISSRGRAPLLCPVVHRRVAASYRRSSPSHHSPVPRRASACPCATA